MFLLWEILTYIDIENDATNIEAIIKGNNIFVFHLIILVNKKISLIVLIVGGAEMLIAININHQKLIFGDILINPLNKIMFRDEYFLYKSFTRRNNADDDSPWANIIIMAPVSPIWFMEKIPINTNLIWDTEE